MFSILFLAATGVACSRCIGLAAVFNSILRVQNDTRDETKIKKYYNDSFSLIFINVDLYLVSNCDKKNILDARQEDFKS